MNCDELRGRLMISDRAEATVAVDAHLEECAACRDFLARFALARESLRAHRSEHLPGPLFARRVSAAVPGGSDLLGWAAVRLLPAALALTLALTAWAWLATPAPGELAEQAPTDDLLAWALEEDGS